MRVFVLFYSWTVIPSKTVHEFAPRINERARRYARIRVFLFVDGFDEAFGMQRRFPHARSSPTATAPTG